MSRQERYTIIVMVYLSLFTLGLIDNLRGALFPEILRFFHTSNSLGAWFYIVASLFSILGGLITNKLSQKWEAYSVWRAGLGAMSLGSFIIFFATNFNVLLLACAVLGLGFGILAVTQNLLVSQSTTDETRKKALSGLHSMYGISSFLAPLCVTMSVFYHLPWQDLYLGAGGLSFALLLSSFHPHWTFPKTKVTPTEEVKKETPTAISGTTPSAALLITAIASYVGLEMLVCTRLTIFLTSDLHWQLSSASNYLTYFFLFLLAGRLLFSFYHPPLSMKQTMTLSLLGSLLFLFLGLKVHPLFLALTGLSMAPFYPIGLALLAETFPERVTSVMSTTIMVQSFSVIAMNFIVGWISQEWSVTMALNLGFGFILLSLFCLIKSKGPKVEKPICLEPLPGAVFEDEFPREWIPQSDELRTAVDQTSSPLPL